MVSEQVSTKSKRGFRLNLANAFSVRGESTLSKDESGELIEIICQKLAEKNLIEAAVMVMESSYPLAFLGSQAMLVVEPLLGNGLEMLFPNLMDAVPYDKLRQLLENRDSVQLLMARLNDYLDTKRGKRKLTKKKRWSWR
ncbi:hypothetical protein K8R78_03480 [bacterium]|nr:hypothetical protein [bacterium]